MPQFDCASHPKVKEFSSRCISAVRRTSEDGTVDNLSEDCAVGPHYAPLTRHCDVLYVDSCVSVPMPWCVALRGSHWVSDFNMRVSSDFSP